MFTILWIWKFLTFLKLWSILIFVFQNSFYIIPSLLSFWSSDYTHKWNLDITVSQVCEALSVFFNIFSLKPDLITSINSTSGSLYLFSINSILLISLSYVVAMTDTLFLSSRISIWFFFFFSAEFSFLHWDFYPLKTCLSVFVFFFFCLGFCFTLLRRVIILL